MKKSICALLLVSMIVSLTGCTIGGSDISVIPPLTLDEVAGKRLIATTNDEREAEMYKFVSDRIVVDKSRLIEVDATDRKNITSLFGKINTFLTGTRNDSLSDEYANYLLLEFAKTPYEWQQSNMDIVGFDPAARLYFVDVTYSTTGVMKQVVPNSKIPNGSPEGDKLKQKRYTDYMAVLSFKYNGAENWYDYYTNFEKTWGPVASIMEEQQGTSLLDRTMKKGAETGGIGKLTYAGLVADQKLSVGATMTVRYVLKYRLNLGEETDLMVNALYVKDYSLNNIDNILKSYQLEDVSSVEVLKPFIDQLILSYNKAVEESNAIGLYQLFEDYSNIDKYYDEIRDYTYNSIGGYTYKILNRNGSNVAVQVNRINQIRAKGANMSLPTYDETVIFNLVLGKDDTIRIKSVHPVKVTLIGEPLSVIRNVSGISDIIQYSDVSFTSTNKTKVENLLKEFSQVVTNAEIESDAFLKTVDLGVSQTTLNRMVDTIVSIKPNKKAMYIVSWDTKTNVYCSVTVREVFECAEGNYDTEAVIDMVNRNGEWKVVNYTRTLNVRTSKTILNTDTAFTVNERTSAGETTKAAPTTPVVETPVVSPPSDNTGAENENEPTSPSDEVTPTAPSDEVTPTAPENANSPTSSSGESDNEDSSEENSGGQR